MNRENLTAFAIWFITRPRALRRLIYRNFEEISTVFQAGTLILSIFFYGGLLGWIFGSTIAATICLFAAYYIIFSMFTYLLTVGSSWLTEQTWKDGYSNDHRWNEILERTRAHYGNRPVKAKIVKPSLRERAEGLFASRKAPDKQSMAV